jgi:hypothetical protein
VGNNKEETWLATAQTLELLTSFASAKVPYLDKSLLHVKSEIHGGSRFKPPRGASTGEPKVSGMASTRFPSALPPHAPVALQCRTSETAPRRSTAVVSCSLALAHLLFCFIRRATLDHSAGTL